MILPGGESTAQWKLLRELNLFEPLREMICGGLPVLATCAGLIPHSDQGSQYTSKAFSIQATIQ